MCYDFLREELFVLNTWEIFCLFVFFVGMTFHAKTINHTLAVCYCNQYLTPPAFNSTMISPVVAVKEGMVMKNQTKTKIGVGSVVKSKVGEL